MALIERGPNKPTQDLEERVTEVKERLNAMFKAGMQTHEVQDALGELNRLLDDLSVDTRGLRVKVKE